MRWRVGWRVRWRIHEKHLESVRITNLASFLILLGMDVQFTEYIDSFLVSVRRIQAVGSHQCLCGLVCLFTVVV